MLQDRKNPITANLWRFLRIRMPVSEVNWCFRQYEDHNKLQQLQIVMSLWRPLYGNNHWRLAPSVKSVNRLGVRLRGRWRPQQSDVDSVFIKVHCVPFHRSPIRRHSSGERGTERKEPAASTAGSIIPPVPARWITAEWDEDHFMD